VRSVDEYVELMANLKLGNPKMMGCRGAGQHACRVAPGRSRQAGAGAEARARGARKASAAPDILLVDLRENSERAKHGTLAGALHAALSHHRGRPEARRHAARGRGGDRPPQSCSSAPSAERSAMAVNAAKDGRPAQRGPISQAASTPGRRLAGPVLHG